MRRCVPLAMVALLAALRVAPAFASAVELQVEPGLWEFQSTMPEALSGGAGPQAYRTCLRERTITPEGVMARHKECRITGAQVSGATARWKMTCRTPAGALPGIGSLRTNGVAVAGSFDFSVTLGSVEVPLKGTFRGKRVGACR